MLMTILKDYEMSPNVLEMEINPFSQNKDIFEFCQSGQVMAKIVLWTHI